MVSFRFPFSFSQPTFPPAAFHRQKSPAPSLYPPLSAPAFQLESPFHKTPPIHLFITHSIHFFPISHLWGSLSLSDGPAAVVTESKTGVSFPAVLNDSQGLLGIGLRRKAVFGLKNIDVYAFGVYADDNDIKNFINDKYGTLSATELKHKDITEDLMESDISFTVRLQIVYGRLSIRSVRNAFEDSVGNRLKKFGGSENKELLQKFTSQFRDEFKIPRGSIIDLSKEKGYEPLLMARR